MHLQELLDDLFIVVFTIGESIILVSLIRERCKRGRKVRSQDPRGVS